MAIKNDNWKTRIMNCGILVFPQHSETNKKCPVVTRNGRAVFGWVDTSYCHQDAVWEKNMMRLVMGTTRFQKSSLWFLWLLSPVFAFISQRFQPQFNEVKVIFTQHFDNRCFHRKKKHKSINPTLSLHQDNTIRIPSHCSSRSNQIFHHGIGPGSWTGPMDPQNWPIFSHETNDLGPIAICCDMFLQKHPGKT